MADTSTDITTMTAEETVAYLRENPAQVDAVRDAEQAREHPRKTVLAALKDAEGIYDPVGDYPERPSSEAISDQRKQELTDAGLAVGEGDSWRVIDPAILPGS